MTAPAPISSVVLAAGRGSRMQGYSGNKTLLPLVPERSPFQGNRPILLEILANLPPGPCAVVVHHKREDVIAATSHLDISYCEQPQMNGTGGAVLASRGFLQEHKTQGVLITMGDIPLVRAPTFQTLMAGLARYSLVVLGFQPRSRKKYGVLDIHETQVKRIIEWQYWNRFSPEEKRLFRVCNSGIYAARRGVLLHYLTELASQPHVVRKAVEGTQHTVEEFFFTDIVQFMWKDGLPVGYVVAEEDEVLGVDDLMALEKAQRIFAARIPAPPAP